MKLKLMFALGCLALATPVLAAGLYDTFPTIGGPAVCSSTSTGVNGQVCTTTTPAGPTTATGNETIPADTNLTQGLNPATVQIPLSIAASGAWISSTPLTGTTVVIPNNITNYVIRPAGTIAALTVTLPSTPVDGQLLRISSSATISSLTVNGAAGQTVSNAPTILTVSTTTSYGYSFIYSGTLKTWYRTE